MIKNKTFIFVYLFQISVLFYLFYITSKTLKPFADEYVSLTSNLGFFTSLDFDAGIDHGGSYGVELTSGPISALGGVLGLTISKKLIDLYPDEEEGILDKKLASLVNKNICYEVGNKLGLKNYIYIGKQSKKKSVIQNKIISDSCEALIGAVYIEKGFEFTEKFVLKIWKDFILTSDTLEIDPKTKLQEYSLKMYKSLPIYKVVSNTGPRHKPKFKVAVKIKNFDFVESFGSSKKNAEQSAAKSFLKKIDIK